MSPNLSKTSHNDMSLKKRRESGEKRKEELHEWAILLAQAKVDHQYVLTSNAKLDGIIASTRISGLY